MRCGRADRVELDAFLLNEAGDEALDAFREHYPHCADCAAAVADWMTLDGAMREVLAEAGEARSPHPEPEELALFAEAPKRMGERAMQIENHLATCTSCGHELRLIANFDPAMFGAGREAMPVFARERTQAEPGFVDTVLGSLAA
ncbi:hypothetical protein K2X89_06585, partial [Myxococcota bacterium]|nr:hypothetical protein [Myxococcota bacterium]